LSEIPRAGILFATRAVPATDWTVARVNAEISRGQTGRIDSMNRILRLSAVSCCLVAAGCGSNDGSPASKTGAGGSTVQVQKDGGAWKPFRSPDGKYTVLFPGEPQKLESSSEGETSYAVELEQGGGYTVMHVGIEEFDPKEIESRLSNIRNDVVGAQKVLYEATPQVSGRPARDFAFVDGEGLANYYRVLIAGPRLYQVMTVIEEAKFAGAKEDRQKFLDSFELIE
jgi:hypothetical protein